MRYCGPGNDKPTRRRPEFRSFRRRRGFCLNDSRDANVRARSTPADEETPPAKRRMRGEAGEVSKRQLGGRKIARPQNKRRGAEPKTGDRRRHATDSQSRFECGRDQGPARRRVSIRKLRRRDQSALAQRRRHLSHSFEIAKDENQVALRRQAPSAAPSGGLARKIFVPRGSRKPKSPNGGTASPSGGLRCRGKQGPLQAIHSRCRRIEVVDFEPDAGRRFQAANRSGRDWFVFPGP